MTLTRSSRLRAAAALAVLTLAGCGQPAGTPAPEARTVASVHQATPRAVTGTTVVAAGDVVCAPGSPATADSCQQRATAALVTSLKPVRVLALGDLQYERGALPAFRRAYADSWGAFKRRTRTVPGNHEYNTPGASGYYRYFHQQPPGYRAISIGSWRAYLLNSNCTQVDCAAERAWLRRDLEAHPTACTLVAMHHPRYSSGPHGSQRSVTGLWRTAYRQHVDLALAGHDHLYERFAPMNATGQRRADGIVSFVVGTGGASLYQRQSHAPGSRYFQAGSFGVLELTLGDGEFAWAFHTLDGTVRDGGSHACH
ncbi:MAG TPA: metallophosphoesterase [Nocardioides sp.]|uniref:metallophosphoesterase family protein n=1 Tax=Nocardioides sp. TaxID=35761 RepID=UPI002BA84395|nr:metallophosphoesterase [Nocardioides sp.]HQR25941.1 metallophosphoesterase [Nocardioides sp.]